mmetsp:Transcript_41944/g.100817  ORF Transcript_41944/g.100817 Transcript_41944/m.100817 type:complete len:269 (-) Transcript_41944:117-923(-)
MIFTSTGTVRRHDLPSRQTIEFNFQNGCCLLQHGAILSFITGCHFILRGFLGFRNGTCVDTLRNRFQFLGQQEPGRSKQLSFLASHSLQALWVFTPDLNHVVYPFGRPLPSLMRPLRQPNKTLVAVTPFQAFDLPHIDASTSTIPQGHHVGLLDVSIGKGKRAVLLHGFGAVKRLDQNRRKTNPRQLLPNHSGQGAKELRRNSLMEASTSPSIAREILTVQPEDKTCCVHRELCPKQQLATGTMQGRKPCFDCQRRVGLTQRIYFCCL